MKCSKCGAGFETDLTHCPQCGALSEDVQDKINEETEPGIQAETNAGTMPEAISSPMVNKPNPNRKFIKILVAIVAAVAIIVIAALAYVKMNAKDPKQVVIDAFKNVYTEGQVFPFEELFGFNEFAENAQTSDSESGITLKMNSCSDPTVNQFAGSGLRLEGKRDWTNQKISFNMGGIYNGMDLANLDMYYGNDILMMMVPELSSKVFTMDLGEGLADRIKSSPTVGPLLEESGIDLEGLTAYFTDLIDGTAQAAETGQTPFDMDALLTRYREGCKAQENFEAAMTVTKASKGTYTMNGAEVSCQGYEVLVSKDSMIEFLRTSSDFFLQDETLKGDYLKQLETTVKMSELMGSAMTGTQSLSAQELQEQMYDDVNSAVDQIITYLDKNLTDVHMFVYVDKNGNLTALDGTTQLHAGGNGEGEDGFIDVTFNLALEGGSYLTQNMKGNITLKDATDTVKLDLVKQETYDGKKLTCDLSLDVTDLDDETYTFMYTGTYDSNDGSYHADVELSGQELQYFKISANGTIDQLEKGKSYHMDIEALEIAAMDHSVNMVLSGELYNRPLSSEVTPLEGKNMDILAATEEEWGIVMMEMAYAVIGMAEQLGISMY